MFGIIAALGAGVAALGTSVFAWRAGEGASEAWKELDKWLPWVIVGSVSICVGAALTYKIGEGKGWW